MSTQFILLGSISLLSFRIIHDVSRVSFPRKCHQNSVCISHFLEVYTYLNDRSLLHLTILAEIVTKNKFIFLGICVTLVVLKNLYLLFITISLNFRSYLDTFTHTRIIPTWGQIAYCVVKYINNVFRCKSGIVNTGNHHQSYHILYNRHNLLIHEIT
jgi:hypothetical protein